MLGRLVTCPVADRLELVADPVRAALTGAAAALAERILVAEIDPALSDTAAFCAAYDIEPVDSANCVVVAGKREGEARLAAAVLLATTRLDVNGAVRRRLDVRKASFAPMDVAVEQTGMAYGAITPLGLPPGWPLLVDPAVADRPYVVIGSGRRQSKLLVPGADVLRLPGAEPVPGLAAPVAAA